MNYSFTGVNSCTHTLICGSHGIPGWKDKMDCLYSSTESYPSWRACSSVNSPSVCE